MNDRMTTIWQGVEIEYNESKDRWVFTLRGRERSADSLALAKAAIDKPPPKDRKPFERVKVWMKGGIYRNPGFHHVTATSIAADKYGHCPYVWVTDESGQRSKEPAEQLYPCDSLNDSCVEKWRELQVKIDALEKQKKLIQNHMTHLHVQTEEDEA